MSNFIDPATVTVEQYKELAAEVTALHVAKKEAEEKFEEAKKVYNAKAWILTKVMKHNNENRVADDFGKMTLVTRHGFKIVDYEAAMDFFKEDGSYEDLLKITSADAAKRIGEIALMDGPDGKKVLNPNKVPVGFEYSSSTHFLVTPA